MSTLAVALLSMVTTASSTTNYQSAYKVTAETGRPLVVLVGADWCPGCQTMKQSVLPQLERRGSLNGVSLAVVNCDQEEKLAGKLMKGSSIPQLIMYVKTDKGWDRKEMVGAQPPEAVEAFLSEGTSRPIATLGQK